MGALLKENGYDVEILNWYDIHKTPGKIRETLISKNPNIVGFSIVHANRWGGIDIARTARDLNPGVKIVSGGIGASFLWEHLLTHFSQIDYGITGEGEFPFLKLVEWLDKGAGSGEESIEGLAYRKHGKVLKNSCSKLLKNPDDLPDPARYFSFRHGALSRGCPGNCTFCGSPRFWGRRVRFHSSGYFVDQLQRLYRRESTSFFSPTTHLP